MRKKSLATAFILSAIFSYPLVSASQNDNYWNATSQAPTSTPSGATYSFSNITQHDNNGSTTFISSSSPSTGYNFTLNGAFSPASGNENFALSPKGGVLNTTSGGSTFVETTVTPAVGYALNISNVNFASRSTTTGPTAFSVQKVTGSSTIELAIGTLSTNSTWLYKNNPVSAIGGTNEPITIRIYGYAGSGSAGTANWRLDDIVITVSSTPLPVTFDKVQATQSNGQLKVLWTTSSETNNDHFDVEVSQNGKDFTKIATLKSKAVNGNSTTPLHYEYTAPVSEVAVAAMSFLLVALAFGFKKRNIKQLSFIAITIIAMISISSCQKENFTEANLDGKIFVRIGQIDIDGTKVYSRVIQALQD